MPWEETDVNDLRNRFIDALRTKEWKMAPLCREFGISRKTGYKWQQRHDAGGRAALIDRSSAPLHHPNAMSQQTIQALLQARARHPHWGPLKLLAELKELHPEQSWPAASSVGALLKRHGLSQTRPPRPRTPPYTQPLAHATAANQLWCADFKGWFKTADGRICHPLTVSDAYSRYLLCLQGLHSTHGSGVIPHFEQAFREYGMPLAIRTDNGSPFASCGLAGLTRLSVWWLHLGIGHERIEPGHPEQNGQHERMHRTLKAEATKPPKADLSRQQLEFDRFRLYFDEERPHAALEQRTPGKVYRASLGQNVLGQNVLGQNDPISPTGGGALDSGGGQSLNPAVAVVSTHREYPKKLPEWEYAPGTTTRSVRSNGEIKWQGELIFVSEVLIGETVRLQEIADGQWQLYLGPHLLAVRDRDNQKWLPPAHRTPATGRRNGREDGT